MEACSDGESDDEYFTPDYVNTPIILPYARLKPKFELLYPINDFIRRNEELKVYKLSFRNSQSLVLKHTKIPKTSEIKTFNLIKEYYVAKTISLFSPYVVRMLDLMIAVDEEDITIEILMEFGGEDLESVKVKQGIAVKVAGQLIDLLAVMEKIGVSHIDIKPKNVLWDGKRVRLIDFPGAIMSYEHPEALMEPLNEKIYKIGGYTKAYAPAELVDRKKNHSVMPQKADAYSFGSTFGFLLLREHGLNPELSKVS